jgi:hypothetical protein
MTTIYKWRIYCNTDNRWEYVWSETQPTTCPINTNHTVNNNSVNIVETLSDTIVALKENTTGGTGDHVKFDTLSFTVAPNSTYSSFISWPMPIEVLSLNFKSNDDNEDDILNCYLSPNTNDIIGTITANVSPNDTIINVSSTVLNYIQIGFYVKLFDGINNDDLGRVASIDISSSTITVETPVTNSFLATSPTYVQMRAYYMKGFVVGIAGDYTLGAAKIGGTVIPAGLKVNFDYINVDTLFSKKLVVIIEYIY